MFALYLPASKIYKNLWEKVIDDAEAHPFLSPDDEFADYETWDIGNLDSGCLTRS